ncbi:hypothetical protein BDZ94DRAFT_1324514 [Collybia nuda]|uniref:Uncharacterized protein n=1 Tax=Collybia nuda TaxID=64659 RepID=A0A9P5Y047_9AGAR|nr:hypothetical protein BDZ94DRAFT_1324514 [Collybia nuda]
MSAKMYEENQALQLEISGMRVEIASLKQNGDTGPYGAGRHTSLSIGPSDSIFQQPSWPNTAFGFVAPPAINISQARECPMEYPFKVLWFKRDCQQDTDACPSDTNPSRPPMRKAIRNEQGDMISEEYYNSILKSATLYVNKLVLLIHTKAPTQAPRKTYVEKHFPNQWRSIINQFETEHPPLALCASHWKANQLLSEMLCARKPGIVDPEVKIHTNTTTSSSKKKRTNSSTESTPNHGTKKQNIGHSNEKEEPQLNDDTGEGEPQPNNRGEQQCNDLSPALGQKPVTTLSMLAEPATTKVRPTPRHKGKEKVTTGFSFDDIYAGALMLGRGKPPSTKTTTLASQESHTNGSGSSILPLPKTTIVGMISVQATYSSLKEASTQEFSEIPHLPACLESLQKVSASAAFNGQPCSMTLALLNQIESADPTAPDINEDDTNLGWGHMQFTASGLTLSTVIRSWENIGNVATAYQLLAAAIKTCRVAQHLCFTNNIVATGGFLSDNYLQNLVEILWDILKLKTSEQSDLPSVATPHNMATSTSSTTAPAGSSEDHPPTPTTPQKSKNLAVTTDYLQELHKVELKRWMIESKITVPPYNKQNKDDLIKAIRTSDILPNQEAYEHFVSQRKKKQASRKSKTTTT